MGALSNQGRSLRRNKFLRVTQSYVRFPFQDRGHRERQPDVWSRIRAAGTTLPRQHHCDRDLRRMRAMVAGKLALTEKSLANRLWNGGGAAFEWDRQKIEDNC